MILYVAGGLLIESKSRNKVTAEGVSTLTAYDQETIRELTRMIREILVTKLASKLDPVIRGRYSTPDITFLGKVVGHKDPAFVSRFGADLEKVTDEDIWRLMRYLPSSQPTRVQALLQLYEYIESAPEGKTGLAFFDEWEPAAAPAN